MQLIPCKLLPGNSLQGLLRLLTKEADRSTEEMLDLKIQVAIKMLAAGKAEALHLLNADTLLHAVIRTYMEN